MSLFQYIPNLDKKQSSLGIAMNRWEWFLVLAPCLITISFVLLYSTNVLYWDEWDGIAGFFINIKTNGFSWAQMWAQHNEHRVLLPRLIYYMNSFFDLSPVRNMIASQVITAASWCLLAHHLHAKNPLPKTRQGRTFLFLQGLFFFSLVQCVNFFTGFHLVWQLTTFGALLAILGLTQNSWWLLTSGILVAYFNGLGWQATFVVVFLGLSLSLFRKSNGNFSKKLMIRLLLFIGLMILLSVFYFRDYQTVEHHPRLTESLTHPFRLLAYFLMLVGSPLGAFARQLEIVFGFAFLYLLFYLFKRGQFSKRPLEFLVIGWSLILSMMISLSRSSFANWQWDWNQQTSSRYTTIMIPAWVALFWILYEIFPIKKIQKGLMIFLFINLLFATDINLRWARNENKSRQEGMSCLRTELFNGVRSSDRCLQKLYPNPDHLRRVAQQLRDLGLWF